MAKYTVEKLNTLVRGGQVSLSYRTYYKTRKKAQEKANKLNKNL